MRFNNSTQKPRSQLPRLLRFWLGQPAGQTRSLAPRVWGQSVGPNSSIPIAGAAHPLLTVYDHFHSVFHLKLFYFTVKACGLSSRLALGRGNLELSIVFFFVKAAIAPQKGKSTPNSCPRPSKKKSSRWGGNSGEDFQKCSQEARWILILVALLWFRTQHALPSSFSFKFSRPHTLAPHFGPTLCPPPPELIFGGGRRFGK